MKKKQINRLKAIAMALSTLGLSTGCTTKIENEQINTEDGIVQITEEKEPMTNQIETMPTTTTTKTTTMNTTVNTTTKTTATTTSVTKETYKTEESYQGTTFYADEYEVCRNMSGASNKMLALVKDTEESNSVYYLIFDGNGKYEQQLVAQNAIRIGNIDGIPVIYIDENTKKYTEDKIYVNNNEEVFSPILPDLTLVGCEEKKDINLFDLFTSGGIMSNQYRIVYGMYENEQKTPSTLIYYKAKNGVSEVSNIFGTSKEEIGKLNNIDANDNTERELLIKVLPQGTTSFVSENGYTYHIYSNTLVQASEITPCEKSYSNGTTKSAIITQKEKDNNQVYFAEFNEDGTYYMFYCGRNIKNTMSLDGIPVFQVRSENDTTELSTKGEYSKEIYETVIDVVSTEEFKFYKDNKGEIYFTIQSDITKYGYKETNELKDKYLLNMFEQENVYTKK